MAAAAPGCGAGPPSGPAPRFLAQFERPESAAFSGSSVAWAITW